MSFQSAPIQTFLRSHNTNDKLLGKVFEAVLPAMFRLVDNKFVLDPLLPDDLESARLALQTWLGYSVREARALSLEELLARPPDEDDEVYEVRVQELIDGMSELHHDIVDIYDGVCGSFLSARVSDGLESELEEAYEAALAECEVPDEETVVGNTVHGYTEIISDFQALALFAAALDEPAVYERVAPLLPLLTRCVPIGELIEEPGVWTVLTGSVPQ